MQFPDDDNGALLREMHEAGVDLSQTHDIDFFFIFKTKKEAEAMIAALAASGEPFTTTLEKNEVHEDWDLRCALNMVPTYERVTSMEARLAKLAEKYNGQDDGWGLEE